MNEQTRLEVHKKYGCRCAYCGNLLLYEKMQVDHIKRLCPKYYNNKGKKYSLKEAIRRYARDCETGEIAYPKDEQEVRSDYKKNNELENLNPACYGCNHYKGKWDLEYYRHLVQSLSRKMHDEYLIKRGIEYGIVEIKEWDGVFFFEKYDPAVDYARVTFETVQVRKETFEEFCERTFQEQREFERS